MHFDIGDYRMIEWIVVGKKVVGLFASVERSCDNERSKEIKRKEQGNKGNKEKKWKDRKEIDCCFCLCCMMRRNYSHRWEGPVI